MDRLGALKAANGGSLTGSPHAEEVRRLLAEVEVLDRQPLAFTDMHGNPASLHNGTPGRGGVTSDTVTLRADQSFAEWARVKGVGPQQRGSGTLDFGRWLKGTVAGDWTGAGAEMRASLQEGSIGGGGALVPSPLSGILIDLARAKARVIEAGATTVPMTASTLAIARLASDPGSAWKTESAAVASPTDPTFERVTFTARTLVGFARASRELFEDAGNLGQVVADAFAHSLALKIDLAALYGSGVAPEPLGVKNTSGVTIKSMGTNGAALTNFGRLKDTVGQPMRAPDEIANIPRLDTSSVPNNLTQGSSNLASDIFGGEFEHLMIGIRTGLRIEVIDQAFLATNYEVGMIASLRADIQLAHPAAFVVTEGVL